MSASNNPYVGPRTFQEDERDRFFGREREASELLARVISSQELVFYAQSGAGKSSLVNTRLIRDLKDKGFEVLRGRVGGDAPVGLEVDNIFAFNLLRSLSTSDVDLKTLARQTLDQFLVPTALTPPPSDGRNSKRRALIIDQFEEIFSTHQEAWEKRRGFFEQLACGLEADARLRLVLVMREDYIASLDPYASLVPGQFRMRYYMQRLEYAAALKAVQEPVKDEEFSRSYAEGVAEKLVDDLRDVKVYKPDGSEVMEPGQYVEPVQLQVVCYNLWENLSEGGTQITEQDLQNLGDVSASLGQYYATRLKAVAEAKHVNERKIRNWFTEKLISPTGIRNMVLQERGGKSGGLENDVIQSLPDLVRAETRGGATFYELTHDRLVEPIIENNRKWLDNANASLENLYAERVKEVAEVKNVSERKIRRWFEEKLILDGKIRQMVAHDPSGKSRDLEDDIIKELDDFVRTEQHEGTTFYELTDDFLVEHIIANNKAWAEIHASPLQRQAALWQQQERNESWLFADQALAEVEQWAKEHQDELSDPEREFLEESRAKQKERQAERERAAQQEKLETTQRRLELAEKLKEEQTRSAKLARTFSIVASILMLIALFASVSAIFQRNDAIIAKNTAVAAEAEAQSQKDRAQKKGNSALSGQLSAYALDKLNSQPDLAMLLSLEADRVASSLNTQNALLTALQQSAQVRGLINEPTNMDEAQFSPDGKVMTLRDKTGITLWDAESMKQLNTTPFNGHYSSVYSIAFSPDGKIMASGAKDGSIVLWDATTHTPIGEPLKGHTTTVWSVAFSPDGKLLASGSGLEGSSNGATIILWDVETRRPIVHLNGHKNAIISVAFSPDGKTLASGGVDQRIILWDIAAQENIGELLDSSAVSSVAFSQDGKTLASGNDEGIVALWDVSTQTEIIQLAGHGALVRSVAFSPKAKILASGSYDNTVILWDVAKQTQIAQFTGHTDPIKNIAFSPDGKILASGSNDNSIFLWDVQNHTKIAQIRGHTDWVRGVAFNADGKTLASASVDSTVRFWDVSNPKAPKKIGTPLQGNLGSPLSMQFSADGTWLASSGDDGTILFNVATQAQIGYGDFFRTNPDVGIVAFQTTDNTNGKITVHIKDIASGREQDIPITGTDPQLALSGKMLVYQTIDEESKQSTLHLWDVRANKELLDIPGEEPVFSPDSQLLIYRTTDTEGSQNFINLQDIANPKNIREPIQGTFYAITQDSETLIYYTKELETDQNVINLWDISEARQRGRSIAGDILSMSKNGEVLAFQAYNPSTGDPSINLLNTSTGEVLTNQVEGNNVLGLSDDGKFLFYQTYDNDLNSVIHTVDVQTGSEGASPTTGDPATNEDGSYKIFQAGQILGYETLNYNNNTETSNSSLVLINTSTATPTGNVINEGSYLGQTSDGKLLLYQTIENESSQINLMDTATSQLIGKPIKGAYLGNSPDGKTLAFRNESGLITLLDLTKSWPLGEPVSAASDKISGAVLSPDGKTLAWIGRDGITIQDTSTGELLGKTFSNHFGDVNSLYFSSDGKSLVSRGEDGSIALWDLATHEQTARSIAGAQHSNLLLSNDGKTLVVSDYNEGRTRLWNLVTQQQIGDPIPGRSSILNPDGTVLAVGDRDTNVTTLWDLNTHAQLGKTISGSDPIFSPDGRLLFVGDLNRNRSTLWILSSFIKVGNEIPGFSGTFDSTGKRLAIRDQNGITTVWDMQSIKKIGKAFQGDGSLGLDGKILALNNYQKGTITLKNISDPANPRDFPNQPLDGSNAWFDPSGTILAVYKNNSDQNQNSISLFELDTRELKQINPQPIPESGFAFSPKGKVVAYIAGDRIVIWDGSSQPAKVNSDKIYPGAISGMTFNKDGDILAVYGNQGIVLWDVNKNKRWGEPLQGPVIAGTGMTISPNGKVLASFASDGIALRDLNSNKDMLLETGTYSGQLTSRMSFYANGKQFMALGSDGTLLSWDVASGRLTIPNDQVQPLKGKSITLSVFSPDGKYLAYEGGSGLNIWDLNKSQPYAKAGDFPITENSIGALLFSPDGSFMAYSDGPKVSLWNMKDKKLEDTLVTEATSITNLNLIMRDASIEYLITVDQSGATQIWDWASHSKIGIPLAGDLQIAGLDAQNHIAYYIDSSGKLIKWKWNLSLDEWKGLLCPLAGRNFTHEEWKQYIGDEPYEAICPQFPTESAMISVPATVP